MNGLQRKERGVLKMTWKEDILGKKKIAKKVISAMMQYKEKAFLITNCFWYSNF